MLNHLMWSGEAGWAAATAVPWSSGDVGMGLLRQFGGLALARFSKAGHMTPVDQPAAAYDLLTRFLGGQQQLNVTRTKH